MLAPLVVACTVVYADVRKDSLIIDQGLVGLRGSSTVACHIYCVCAALPSSIINSLLYVINL